MFEFSSPQFFWSLINFVLLVAFLYKVALPPLFKMVEDAESKRNQELKDLEINNSQLKILIADYQEKLSKINDEARQILDNARKEREELKRTEVEKIHAEKQQILQGIRDEIQFEKKKVVADLKEHSAELVAQTAAKLFKVKASKEDQFKIVEENLKEFEGLLLNAKRN